VEFCCSRRWQPDRSSFSVPLLFDDFVAVTENQSIRHLWPIGRVLFSSSSTTVGRPLLNLTLALNYAFGGTAVRGYHAVNLGIHLLAGLTLLGIVRRTLSLPKLSERFGEAALPLALSVALLWTLHPVQTVAVTYISQRAESLMGLWYLLTLYCFIRGAASPVSRAWYACSILACALGMATKEVMVTAPCLVLLYDRTFVGGAFKLAWRQRWRFYGGLGATWLLLAWLMTQSNLLERGVGYEDGYGEVFSWWTYALTECRVVTQYLKLAVWPSPLIFDYGPIPVVTRIAQIIPEGLFLGTLIVATLAMLWRRAPAGFVGGWFFAILAATSSVVPVTSQPMAENRMYLPLAAVATAVVLGAYALAGRKSFIGLAALALGLGVLTVARNRDYRSELAIWTDTVSKRPDNVRAHNNLATILSRMPERVAEAVAHYEMVLRIMPDYISARYNLAATLTHLPGRTAEAIAQYETVLQMQPDHPLAQSNLANLLEEIPGRQLEAIAHYEAALRINPQEPVAHYNLALALAKIPQRRSEAIAHYETAIRLKPDYADAHYNLANALANQAGRLPDAIAHYEAAIQHKPDFAEAHVNLANALANIPGRLPEMIVHYETALRLKPDLAEAHFNLGTALLDLPGRRPDAIVHFETALRLNPKLEPAREMLAQLRAGKTSP